MKGEPTWCPACNQEMVEHRRGQRGGTIFYCPTCDLTPEERTDIVRSLPRIAGCYRMGDRVDLGDGLVGVVTAHLGWDLQVEVDGVRIKVAKSAVLGLVA